MNYRYNELEYAEKIYKNGFQTDFIKYELILLVKYLKQEKNMKLNDTINFIYKFCEKHIEGYNQVLFYKVIDGAIKEGRKRNNKLIEIKSLPIYKCELEYIDSIKIENDYKKILLSFLINKKISHEVMKINNKNIDNKISVYFNGTMKKYNKILKVSNLKEKHDINLVINKLVDLNLNKNDKLIVPLVKGNIILQYINKIDYKKNNEIFYDMPIDGLNNIGYIYDYYKKDPSIKRCEDCGILIKIKNNKTKYCKKCAKEMQLKWQRESMKKLRNRKDM